MGKVPPFSDLIAATTTSAVHLELRDAYTPSDPQFQDWLAGTPTPDACQPGVARAWCALMSPEA